MTFVAAHRADLATAELREGPRRDLGAHLTETPAEVGAIIRGALA